MIIVRAASLTQRLQIKLAISPSHSILTPGQPLLTLTLFRQAPGRAAILLPIVMPHVGLDQEQ